MYNDDYKNFVDRMGSFDDTLDVSDNDEIKHFGVPGMRWGVVRSHVTTGNVKKVGQAMTNMSNHGKTVANSKYTQSSVKNAKKMTDAELKEKVGRLELENRYINATTQQQGKSTVMNLLTGAAAIGSVAVSAATLYQQVRGNS